MNNMSWHLYEIKLLISFELKWGKKKHKTQKDQAQENKSENGFGDFSASC